MLTCFETLPSTQDYCLEQCRRGKGAGLNVLAYRQTHQRGSRGRHWLGAPGALALSCVVTRNEELLNPSIWPFIAGLAFFDGLVRVTPESERWLRIKWPNDLLLDDRKMGGVLVEIEGRDVIMGFGGNITHPPQNRSLDRRVAFLTEVTDNPPTLTLLANSIVEAVHFWYKRWQQDGFHLLRKFWLKRSFPVGTWMRVRGQGVDKEGYYCGITREGYLELETEKGHEIFVTADILQAQKKK